MSASKWQNPEYRKAYARRYYQQHKATFAAQSRAWAKAHPDKCVENSRKWKYGLTPEEQRALLAGSCSICSTRPSTHIDHCHRTKRVRGGLCNNCNTGLGMFSDDPRLLKRAVSYLEKYNAPIALQETLDRANRLCNATHEGTWI